jgi:hypothetical protein
MPRLQLEGAELTEPDLAFVSLVKRGANRIPFRIVKEDTNDLIDLQNIGARLFKQARQEPVVVTALVRKGADLKAIAAKLAASSAAFEGRSALSQAGLGAKLPPWKELYG